MTKKYNYTKPMPVNGGRLIFYLRNHRREILDYFRAHGINDTLEHYGITAPTLDRLLENDYGEGKPLGKTERALALAEIAAAGNAELRKEIRDMKQQYERFVELLAGQIVVKFVEAIKSIQVDIPPELEYKEKDPLRLDLPGK